MGLISAMLGPFQRKAAPPMPSYVRGNYNVLWPVTLGPQPWTLRNIIDEGYRKNAVVFACVCAYAKALAEAPVIATDRDRTAIPDHPLRALLSAPNPFMSESELMEMTGLYIALGGNAYWYKVLDRRGRIAEIWPLSDLHITPAPGGEDNWISHYVYDPGDGNRVRIEPELISHFKWHSTDMLNPYMAQPPLLAATREANSDLEATRYLNTLLGNDAAPKTIVSFKETLPPASRELLRKQFMERHGGENRGGVAVIDRDVTINRLALTMEEVNFDGITALTETRICAAFGVPPILVGLKSGLDASTYSNYEQARKAFWQDSVVPLMRRVASEIASSVLPFVGGPVFGATFDTSSVAALQEDTDARWNRMGRAFALDGLTLDEYRAGIGYGADARGLGNLYRFEIALKGKATAPALPGDEGKAGGVKALPAPERKAAPTPEERASQIEVTIRERAAEYISEQYRVASDAYGAGSNDPELETDDGSALREWIAAYYALLLAAGWDQGMSTVGVSGLRFDLASAGVARVRDRLVARVARISEETRQNIRDVVIAGVQEGATVEQIAERIAALSDDVTPMRATRIAQYEAASAYGLGMVLGWAETGMVAEVQSSAQQDERTCGVCMEMHGKRFPLSKVLSGEIDGVPWHPGSCRCRWLPVGGGGSQ